ncbi:glycosyltransferase 87 family protein [Nocardioides sp. Iso805N]|uniref:glycosyltransferase 87 family protein n=1 Tax=Nocardioides sp. Iso805N TaxID=1283287 RepID=UPI000370A6BE|nr:glycosyltransferase 87 family protein [Nocardioides sp. Iso805N]
MTFAVLGSDEMDRGEKRCDGRISWWRFDRVPALVAVFLLAYAVRLVPVLRGGGLHFYGRYDDGVYYTGSEALTFGHVPYRDFVLLHPPGSTIALMPFTVLGRLTSDPTGMTVARLSFMALGSLSAVLVAVIAGRWGPVRGLVSGLIYAASAAATYSEQATFLEPLGTFLTLVALLALTVPASRRSRWLDVAAGVALGLSCTVKIWYVAIVAAVLIALLLRRELRSAARLAAACVATAVVVLLPFFLLAPHRMWTMVVSNQLGRQGTPKPRLGRIPNMLGTKTVLDGASPVALHLVTLLVALLVLVAAVLCLRDRRAWPIVACFAAGAVVLIVSPSYFRHYGVLLAAPGALVLAIGLGGAVTAIRHTPLRTGAVIAAAAVVIWSGVVVAAAPTGKSFPSGRFIAAAPAGCIAADDPAALIQMNRLTTNFRRHCDVPVDVTGASYGSRVSRGQNLVFRTWLVDHLTDSDAFVVLRLRRDGLSEQERQQIRTYPILASGYGLNLRRGDGGS